MPSHAEQVLVGRNNRSNDELTHKVARPIDVWMHARGVAGAHVLLRVPNDAPDAVSPPDLQFAADLAAFYCKVANAMYLPHEPVLFCSNRLHHQAHVLHMQARLDGKVPVITASPRDLRRPKARQHKQSHNTADVLLNRAMLIDERLVCCQCRAQPRAK